MTKKMWSLLLTGALIAGVFSAVPAHAAPEIPATVNIEDPAGDSNGLNDQADGTQLGDNPGGVNFVAGDFLKVWFTTTDKLNVHILTSAPGGGGNWAMNYRVFVNEGCTAFQGTVGGKSNADAAPTAVIRDFCGDLENVDGEIVVEVLEDGTGVTTLTFPLGTWPGVEMGATLTTPNARSRITTPAATAPQMDTTVIGTDYTISSGGAPTAPPVVSEPPGKNDPPGQGNQDCAKIKDKKKKKACKKNSGKTPPGAECAAYTPGEQGAEAELITVTSAATAEAPIETPVTMGPAVGLFTGDLPGVGPNPATTQTFYNFQVDSDNPTDGLFIRLDFGLEEDYDIYLNNADGTEAAHVGGFNSAPVAQAGTDGTGNGGHSEQGAEQLDGVLTPDCGGYTLKIANAFGLGEPVMTAWLGAPTWDPAAQAPIPAKAFIL